jgi:hypothetical protein
MRNKLTLSPDFQTLTLSLSPKTFAHSKIVVLSKLESPNLEEDYKRSFKELYDSTMVFLGGPKLTEVVRRVSEAFERTPEEYLSPLWFEKSISIEEDILGGIMSNTKYDKLYLPAGLLNPLSIKLTRWVLNHYFELGLEDKEINIYVERPALDLYLLRWEFEEKSVKGKYRDISYELYQLWKKVYSKFGNVRYFSWGGGLDLDYSKFSYGNELLALPLLVAINKQELLSNFKKEMIYKFKEGKNG